MSKEKEFEKMFADSEVIVDGLGITHFLPAKKCANCDDWVRAKGPPTVK